jgi:hypothetical protein
MPSLRVNPISRNYFYFVLLLYSQKRDLDATLGRQVTGARASAVRC